MRSAPVPAATVDAGAGRRLFVDQACGACHILADAGGAGAIGPSLDRNPRLTLEYAIDVIADGEVILLQALGQPESDPVKDPFGDKKVQPNVLPKVVKPSHWTWGKVLRGSCDTSDEGKPSCAGSKLSPWVAM